MSIWVGYTEPQPHLWLKTIINELDHIKKQEAVRSQFRISKHHYPTFYKEIIQQTLADCLYNEGPRKEKRQTVQQQQQTVEQPVTTPATAPITSHHHPMIIIRLMIIIQSDKDI
ncbi:unnamed protein product [Didymodactylos carnosus]|nr:unnamed protein product [Didymodactylos carnosus]CAF4629576.1 unnamed protein product [Didymodactylos carnosus]